MAHEDASNMSVSLATDFPALVLTWYDGHRRPLPWRDTSDPYRIWLSEVMLQQTQVETVMPYYHRWIARFPTSAHVAQATDTEVLKLWEGLGYYRRARQFHQACQQIHNQHGGQLPTDSSDFRRLPGVGPYTFAAVRSICFGDRLPAVDGNVKRVLARILKRPDTGHALARIVEKALRPAVPRERPGDFNQALMDLGATVCTPRQPQCGACPVAIHCRAYIHGQVADYPVVTERKPIPHVPVAVGVVWRGDQLLISRRPLDGLLGGLWEFPGGKIKPGEAPDEAVRREVEEEVGLKVKVGAILGTIRHAYTHFSITLHAYHCTYIDGTPRLLGCTDLKWIRWDEMGQFPFPRANSKLFPLIEQYRQLLENSG